MKSNKNYSNINDLDVKLTVATDVDLHHDPVLIEKKNKKREIESSDEDSRWRFFSLVVIVYTKIRQAYSLFVFHARVTPCRHTHTHTCIGECLPSTRTILIL